MLDEKDPRRQHAFMARVDEGPTTDIFTHLSEDMMVQARWSRGGGGGMGSPPQVRQKGGHRVPLIGAVILRRAWWSR